MALDYGLYGALRSKDDFAQKRQDRLAESQFLQQRSNMVQQQVAEQGQAQAGVMEYFDELSKQQVLPEDVERVKATEQELRKKVIEGLRGVNGDAKKFLLTGGVGMLKEYKNNLLMSETLTQAIKNKTSYGMYAADASKGRIARPLVQQNEDGSYTETSFGEQLNRFRKGEITNLDYAGSVEPTEIDALEFQKYIKDPNNPYKAAVVDANDVYQMYLQKGAEPWYAKQKALEYKNNGTKWHWGKEKVNPQAEYYKWKMRSEQGASDKELNWIVPVLNGQNINNPTSPLQKGTSSFAGNFETYVTRVGTSAMGLLMNASGISLQGEGKDKKYKIPSQTILNQMFSSKNPVLLDVKGMTPFEVTEGAEIVDIDPDLYHVRTTGSNGEPVDMPVFKVKIKNLDRRPNGSEGNFKQNGIFTPWATFEGEAYLPADPSRIAKVMANNTAGIKKQEMNPQHSAYDADGGISW